MRVTDLELQPGNSKSRFSTGEFKCAIRHALSLTLRNDAGIVDTASARLEAVELSLTDAAERSYFLGALSPG